MMGDKPSCYHATAPVLQLCYDFPYVFSYLQTS